MTIAPAGPLSFVRRPLLVGLCLVAATAWLAHRAPPPPAARRSLPAPARLGVAPAPCAAIEQVQPLHYRIVRSAFVRLFDAPSRAYDLGYHVFPAIHDGAHIGLRLYAIAPCSLVARLGFANGDLVERVNGIALTSPDRVLEAYAWSRHARRIRVELERHGTPLQIVYEIID